MVVRYLRCRFQDLKDVLFRSRSTGKQNRLDFARQGFGGRRTDAGQGECPPLSWVPLQCIQFFPPWQRVTEALENILQLQGDLSGG